jgi:transmembrane sensor
MDADKEKERERIAEEATRWFLANRDADGQTSADDFLAWLRTSPAHVREYIGVSSLAPDLRSACEDLPPLESLVSRARLDRSDPLFPPTHVQAPSLRSGSRWAVAAGVAAIAALGFLLYSPWNHLPTGGSTPPAVARPVSFATQHGQQLKAALSDGSVMHLNTDSAAEVSYTANERRVVLKAGQATFEVAHDPQREFHVLADSAEVIAVGTAFDVRLTDGATAITVVEGTVMVGLAAERNTGRVAAGFGGGPRPTDLVAVSANERIEVSPSRWPAAPVAVDARRETAWLRQQVVFDNETLERVAAEMNRYASIPIEVEPSLRTIEISGVFATDDTDSFLVFLRSLDDVTVQVRADRIVVAAKPLRAVLPR